MTDNDSEPQQISWVPVLDQTGDDLEPMRLITFGIARGSIDRNLAIEVTPITLVNIEHARPWPAGRLHPSIDGARHPNSA